MKVVRARCLGEHFEVTLASGETHLCRRLLLATGVVDVLPQVDGLRELYGRSIFHCPYCDAWEVREQPLAAYGRGKSGVSIATKLVQWSHDVVLCTDGPSGLSSRHKRELDELDIPVRSERIMRLEGSDGILERIVFQTGEPLARRAMFVHTEQVQGSPLPAMLGCEDKRHRTVPKGRHQVTSVEGMYVAGDASRDVQLAIVAAAEGAEAAFAINENLVEQDAMLRSHATSEAAAKS
jgi:thioredoxin reductase